jgi:hypothetical protein
VLGELIQPGQGAQAFEASLRVHDVSFRLITSTMDGAVPAWVSEA